MSFDVFENIFTASDLSGGRVIKVSALPGIDSAESIYTQNDPAGGRAIKVKIIAGGASTGTLQVAGGVALDSTSRNITDTSATPVASTLYMSTSAVTIKTNLSNLTDELLVLDSALSSGTNSSLRINAYTGTTSFIRFSHGTGSSFTNIGDFRASSANGLGFNANTGFPITFYVNDTATTVMQIAATTGDITMSKKLTISVANVLSASALALTGSWISGGSSTTTTPQFLIQPTGAGAASWNTGGTGFGLNSASGFNGNLIALYSNGAATFRVQTDSTTLIGGGNVRVQAAVATGTGQSPSISGTAFSVFPANMVNGHGLLVYTPSITSTAAGDSGGLKITTSFAPAAGAASFNPINIAYTVNASGAQTGVVTGIYSRATETNLNGATHNLIDLGVGASSIFSVSNVGVPNFNQTTSASAGGNAGTHLNIKVGATSYKIALLNP